MALSRLVLHEMKGIIGIRRRLVAAIGTIRESCLK